MTVEAPDRPAAPRAQGGEPDISVVMPCLNEAGSVGDCVRKAGEWIRGAGLTGEIIVVDNGSTDGSPEAAEQAGAQVIHETRRGYGSAYLAGFGAARGRVVVMGDSDGTYDFANLDPLVQPLDDGFDMVVGNRFDGGIQPGAMPVLHRHIGTPILSRLLKVVTGTPVDDSQSGFRAITRTALQQMALKSTGMELASEMILKAEQRSMRVTEVPVEYAARVGESKLKTWSDGWRHLRFLLVHSPNHLFLIPGLVMAVLGGIVMLLALLQLNVIGRTWGIHAEIAGALFVIVGVQVVSLGLCAHAYGMYFMGERDPWFDRMRARFRLEHGLALGGVTTLIGFLVAAIIVGQWISRGFGELGEERLAILAATLIIIGIQTFFSSFLLSIIGLRRER